MNKKVCALLVDVVEALTEDARVRFATSAAPVSSEPSHQTEYARIIKTLLVASHWIEGQGPLNRAAADMLSGGLEAHKQQAFRERSVRFDAIDARYRALGDADIIHEAVFLGQWPEGMRRQDDERLLAKAYMAIDEALLTAGPSSGG